MSVLDWRTLAPKEVLERWELLSFEQAAYVLNLTFVRGRMKGEPNPAAVRALVEAGKLRLIDPGAPRRFWRVSSTMVRYYSETGRAWPAPSADEIAKLVDEEMKQWDVKQW